MRSHLLLLVMFAFFVSLVFALLSKDDPPDQLRFGAKLFAAFVGGAVALGWLMYPI